MVFGAVVAAVVIVVRWSQPPPKEATDSDPVPSGVPGSLNPENTIPWDDGVDQDLEQLNTEVETLLEETK